MTLKEKFKTEDSINTYGEAGRFATKILNVGTSVTEKEKLPIDEYPFISAKYEKGEVKYYFSDIEEIKNLMFETEKEVILVNAIFENVKDKFNINEFIQMLKFTFRILNVSSSWV
jgi:hypothetical protein